MVREHAEKVKAPRALRTVPLWVALGKLNRPTTEHRVLVPPWTSCSASTARRKISGGASAGSLDSGFKQSAAGGRGIAGSADEVTTFRAFYERWVEDHSGRTAVGLCGIPRGAGGGDSFPRAFSHGEDADMHERPANVPVPQFIRYCIDDLKAFLL